MLYDYHLHCEFSDDSWTPMEQQVEKAIELGLKGMCFTDHVDYGIKKDWPEGNIAWRGTKEKPAPLANVDYPAYFAKLHDCSLKYQDKIEIYYGLEFGVQQHTIPRFNKLLEEYGHELDFILLSIHQVEDMEFWTGDFIKGKNQDEIHHRYYEEMYQVITQFDDYDSLAHIDLITRYDPFGEYPFEKIKDDLTKIFKVVIEKDKAIEINTSSWRYNLSDTTPARDILRLYYKLGGRNITIGSDAHTPEYLACHFEDGIQVLKEIGFDHICIYKKHQPVMIEI